MRRSILVLVLALAGILLTPAWAQAHVERPSYWPNPAPDCHVSPCAGGVIPTARSLGSALNDSLLGTTRVVCKSDSLTLLRASIRQARLHGYYIRPTSHQSFSATQAARLLRINQQLFSRCAYHQIQPAVTASHNNDRVVVMPGIYREATSRRQPTHDPRCAAYTIHSDAGDPGALTHKYQVLCPNDANLIAVIGRGIGSGTDPDPALADRHGIPNAGRCIRCNFQLEGSGVSSQDVVVEAGSATAGNGGPSAIGNKKDVGIFVDRADGFVLRNLTVRHAREHDIYVLETDGYLMDRFKVFYAGGYGVLTFVEDHGLVQNCEAAGNGDSGIYPGSGAQTLIGRDRAFYPTARYSQEFRWCDIHHNTGGFSGTDSHGTLIDHNNFYGNALGYTTDVFTASGHPGFPQGGNVVEYNNFYNNNFNPFQAGSDVAPFIGAPVGTGLWLAGGNDNVVRRNRFWGNYRRGMMLFAVPDATVCGPAIGKPVPGCDSTKISTSFSNSMYGNVMGVSRTGVTRPNGVDFWWDAFVGNTANCWYHNTAAAGHAVTSSPASLPSCAAGTNPGSSLGLGDVGNESELISCLAGFQVSGYPAGNPNLCTWTKTPSQPSSAGSARVGADPAAVDPKAQLQAFRDVCASAPNSRTCAPFTSQLGTVPWVSTALQSLMPAAMPIGVDSTRPLSLYTCSWWRQASAGEQAGLVQRLSNWVGKPVEGDTLTGYGSVMKNDRATALFNDRCSFSYAGSLALYKIYGPAAAFATNG